MAFFRMPWGLTGALLVSTYLHSICVSASPSINVALKASFSSAPYLLELLETAAGENATSYFPLLDRIADGYFSKAATDEELYNQFIEVLRNDGHMADAETLSSYQFALSMRSSAPRIEAHYQYYHTAAEPALKREQDTSCPAWVLFNGKQYCSPSLDSPHGDIAADSQVQELPFDRVLGNLSSPASILYADITSPNFGLFHNTLIRTAREGKTSYRIRHKPAESPKSKPLIIPGYGVELALKRTDYIVIDDREAAKSEPAKPLSDNEVKFEDEDVADLKPLSTSELLSLSLKASSYIMQSEEPLDTLVKLSQDFPKYSSAVAAHNISQDFLKEHEYNRAQLVPPGYNVWWMNGVQMIEREIESLNLLELLRRERKLINGVRDLGLTGPEAVELLGHNEVSAVKTENEPQRFDWRDEIEGGSVIIWMNDIEKDKRYEDWPSSLQSMLQRTYPGQLPAVRRDVFNMVIPVDFSDEGDVQTVTEILQSFVKRKISIRFGLVPLTETTAATEHAKVVYHLIEIYGLSSAISYLDASLKAKKLSSSSSSIFKAAVEGRKARKDKVVSSLDGVLEADGYNDRIEASKNWITRLSANTEIPPFFIDGVAIPRNENWLQAMSTRVSTDLQAIQNGVYSEVFQQDQWIPTYFLFQAATRRNPLVIPEDEKTLKILDVNKLVGEHEESYTALPRLVADSSSPKAEWAHLIFVGDLATEAGWKLLLTMVQFREANPSVEVTIVHNPATAGDGFSVTDSLFTHIRDRQGRPFENIEDIKLLLKWDEVIEGSEIRDVAGQYWQAAAPLVRSIGLAPGQKGLLLNGRLIGPIPDAEAFILEDFEQLLKYERANRISPTIAAIEALGISDKMANPLAGAKLSSIVALSSISDIPEGMFEKASNIRMNQFDMWNSTHTAIEIGDASVASIHINALVDPASEQGQRWIPILKVLSELDGVYLRIFLNPKERLQELPVKRFFRFVLESKPSFDETGTLRTLGASFKGVPQDALLTLGLDIPPAWLVAPKVSAHDLDNVKLSSIKSDVDALYELEHILIEGHSREIPSGAAPRGAQLVLATATDSHFADTIIMANLGYFQFKANPGLYKINLQEGRSAEIFEIDSLGSKGWSPAPGDNSTEVVLMSFQGTTLYPRLSRKVGMETEDVLETKVESKMAFVSRGLNFAQGILSGKGKDVAEKEEHADINIFSVASGHLYERMLNIMMVSVMKHTKHTVKFWFIEQFLSPSFKDFIPYLAAEYGFKYEMVTYKWPHWLRSQTEKQREIWGYKILFLDVLFPLSLDKVIFVDADQIVRTDMINLVNHDLQGAPYGFTPMCDSRTEMEGFRFWKQGYWKNFLRGLPYHISALYVVDLHRFRQIAAGDRLRQQYHQLSADPNSLSNLDQDLPNHMQSVLPIHSLPQEWLWCETWCSDESLEQAKTIDLCNNPQTKEPKLDRARRQVPEWTVYDDEIAAVDRKRKGGATEEKNPKSRNHEEAVPTKKDEL